MADRLGEHNNLKIQSLEENAWNKNISQSKKNNWWKVWKSWHFKDGTKVILKRMNQGPWTKFSRSFTQQFVRKTGRITSLSRCAVFTAIDCTEQSKSTNAPLHYLWKSLKAGSKFLKDSATTPGTRQRQVNQWAMTQHRNDLRGKNVCMHIINK